MAISCVVTACAVGYVVSVGRELVAEIGDGLDRIVSEMSRFTERLQQLRRALKPKQVISDK